MAEATEPGDLLDSRTSTWFLTLSLCESLSVASDFCAAKTFDSSVVAAATSPLLPPPAGSFPVCPGTPVLGSWLS